MELKNLSKPFNPLAISWRVGATNKDKSKGIALAYLNARDVQDRLDEVCGIENWQVRFPWHDAGKLNCEIGIHTEHGWIWKGCGAGDTNVEADKGAFSDAFKRAAVRWGIGRYLYDLPNVWINLENRRIPQGELQNLTQRLGAWQKQRFEGEV